MKKAHGVENLKVRLQNNERPDHKNEVKAFMHSSILAEAAVTSGRRCIIESQNGSGKPREVVAWPQIDKNVARNVITLSRMLKDTAGFDLTGPFRISDAGEVPQAETVVCRETTPVIPLSPEDRKCWEFFLEGRLEIAEYTFPGLALENLSVKGPKRSFIVESVNGKSDNVAKYGRSTKVEIVEKGAVAKTNGIQGKLEVLGIPGMRTQLKHLNQFFSLFDVEFGPIPFPPIYCAIAIQGSRGTGKSMLLDRIAATNWGTVVQVNGFFKTALTKIQDFFSSAVDQRQPVMLLIDDINALIGSGSQKQAAIEVIGNGLDDLAAQAKAMNKRPNVVIVATCQDYLEDIPDFLKSRSRFGKYITLSVPDAFARKEIIRYMKPNFLTENFEQFISDLGDRTHAYTGSDLEKLLGRASEALIERTNNGSTIEPMRWDDVKTALLEIRPTAMHDINLKPPTVHWADIGGYTEVKDALQTATKRPPAGQKQLWKPPKGVLLYGPPGCSKTMTAQAMATESRYNFFAVKGGELLNMYVGETEKSIRNLFQRAREASPSIIFFDEIDSLAGSRSGPAGATAGGGVQALTTLLTEMDGFEQLGNVFVLAATNKPDMLDPAMLRPGRFDRLIYVPLPDEKAREAIFSNKARELRFEVDAKVLAEKTKGYSGAEIAQICDGAFAGWVGEVTNDMPVLETAIAKAPKRVTEDILRHFEDWRKEIQ